MFYLYNFCQSRLFDVGVRTITGGGEFKRLGSRLNYVHVIAKGSILSVILDVFAKTAKLFLSCLVQLSIVRGSVVIPWLSARNFFFSVITAKKNICLVGKTRTGALENVSHVTANSILEQCRTFKKLAFLRRFYQREQLKSNRSPAGR